MVAPPPTKKVVPGFFVGITSHSGGQFHVFDFLNMLNFPLQDLGKFFTTKELSLLYDGGATKFTSLQACLKTFNFLTPKEIHRRISREKDLSGWE